MTDKASVATVDHSLPKVQLRERVLYAALANISTPIAVRQTISPASDGLIEWLSNWRDARITSPLLLRHSYLSLCTASVELRPSELCFARMLICIMFGGIVKSLARLELICTLRMVD